MRKYVGTKSASSFDRSRSRVRIDAAYFRSAEWCSPRIVGHAVYGLIRMHIRETQGSIAVEQPAASQRCDERSIVIAMIDKSREND
jgi:hypothetical protein